jgi:hypothetical protein
MIPPSLLGLRTPSRTLRLALLSHAASGELAPCSSGAASAPNAVGDHGASLSSRAFQNSRTASSCERSNAARRARHHAAGVCAAERAPFASSELRAPGAPGCSLR